MKNVNHGIPSPDWDEQLSQVDGHFYQSSAWAKFQEAQGREVLSAHAEGWSWMGAIRHGRGGIKYLYCAYGPTVKKNAKVAIESLVLAAKEQAVDFVRFDPEGEVTKNELALSGAAEVAEMQPKYVLTLDITQSLEDIRKNISQSNRNLINTAEKRGLEFRISENPVDLAVFLDIQRDTAKRAGITPHSDDYFQKFVGTMIPLGICKFYFAEREGKAIAGAICCDWDGVRYYLHAGAYHELNRQHKASIALLWWLIADAKEKGLGTFDYGGVAPEDQPNHPWAGHSRFKRSIGGVTHEHLGTWEIPLNRSKYAIYMLAKKILRFS